MWRLTICAAIGLAGCGAPDTETVLREHGYSEAYVTGYHQGCESGAKAGGAFTKKSSRDEAAYTSSGDYRTGWDYGFLTCKEKEEKQIAIAAAVGTAVVIGSYSAHGADGVDVKGALSGVDTSAIQSAGW